MTVHVYPVADLIEHDLEGTDCICKPDVEFVDRDTGDTYSDGPIVVHHSLDGREENE